MWRPHDDASNIENKCHCPTCVPYDFFHLIWTGQPLPDESEVATESAAVRLVGGQEGLGSGEDMEEEPAEADPLIEVQDVQ